MCSSKTNCCIVWCTICTVYRSIPITVCKEWVSACYPFGNYTIDTIAIGIVCLIIKANIINICACIITTTCIGTESQAHLNLLAAI